MRYKCQTRSWGTGDICQCCLCARWLLYRYNNMMNPRQSVCYEHCLCLRTVWLGLLQNSSGVHMKSNMPV
jgi:hypothetical protein